MKKDTVMAIVLGVLLVVSVLQAVQLSMLKGSLEDGVSFGSTKTTTTPATGGVNNNGGASLPASLENLPTMVGGC